MIGVGVIGYGYWGPNLVRNFAESPSCRLAAVSDLSPERLALVSRRYPGVTVTTDGRELIRHPGVDAVAIATPVSTHFALVSQALRAGKHVLVEKPLAANYRDAAKLVELAGRRGLVLAVDHTFVYTGAVSRIRQMLARGALGEVYYYDSVRVSLGLFQHDVNVVWDLAVHDLAIVEYVLGVTPIAVSATGMSHIQGQPEDMAYLTLFFTSRLIGHIHVNWLAPVKVRRTLIGGSRKMIIYDDLEPSEKLKVYDKGVTLAHTPGSIYKLKIGYRTGDMWAPNLDLTEALHAETQQFIRCIDRGGRPPADGAAGLSVVRVLEAADESLRRQGHPVQVREV